MGFVAGVDVKSAGKGVALVVKLGFGLELRTHVCSTIESQIWRAPDPWGLE